MTMNLFFGALLMMSIATGVVPKPHLRTVKSINDGLLAVGIADKIRKTCPSISARMFKALSFMNALENKAESMGYTKAEIKAYVKSPNQKAKMRARGEAYLASKGVVKSDPESYCTQGRIEIANKSQIGALLRAK
ncbi:MAG: DUF5333 domain-containing protein [Rhodobacterales bacterium]|nr:DUF5333 domain-containing protein [Rhodobacterales bacterium]